MTRPNGEIQPMPDDGFGTTQQAAAYLRVTAWTLNRWRTLGNAPKSYLIGGQRMYRKRDLDAWAELTADTSASRATA